MAATQRPRKILECSMPPLTESEFLALAEAELDRIESIVEIAAGEADADIEVGRVGNVLTLEFDDGSKIIINSQAPMQELWVAARAGGFHFRRNDGRWVDTRSGEELYVALSRYVSQQCDVDVTLAAN
jgi:CyaY protein